MARHAILLLALAAALLATRACGLELLVPANGCMRLSMSAAEIAGGALRVELTGASLADQGTMASGCHRSDFLLRGLESASALQAAACAHPTVVWAGTAGLTPAAGPLEAAFLTLESRCPMAAVLTLEWGSMSSGSSGEGEDGGARLRRKLLQQRQAPAPLQQPNGTAGTAKPAVQAALQGPAGNGSVSAGIPAAAASDKDPTAQPAGTPPIPGQQTPATPASPSNLWSSELACCCPTYRDIRPYNETGYPDRVCCCGERRRCCRAGTSLLTKMCGEKSMCTVLLVVIGVVSLFLVAMCAMGGVCYRRRRLTAADNAAMVRPLSRRRLTAEDRAAESMMALPEQKQEELSVRPAEEGDPDWSGSPECSVCLEKVQVGADTWRVFPCAGHHGICAGCVVDIVKHNRRRRAEHKRVVACPLCRTLAFVPQSMLPGPDTSTQPPTPVTII